jgi:uncharacterized protein YjbI with pentapeptide repeats
MSFKWLNLCTGICLLIPINSFSGPTTFHTLISTYLSSEKALVDLFEATGILPEKSNLNGVDFSKRDLAGRDMSQTKLNHVNFSEANLEGANLQGTELQYANFHKANLKRAHLEYQDVNKGSRLVILWNAQLSEANFSGAFLDQAQMSETNASQAIFKNASMINVQLRDALLIKTDFENANLSEASFYRANLSGANLKNVNFHEASFSMTILDFADVEGADFSESFLNGIDLTNVRSIDKAKSFKGARYNVKTIFPSGFDPIKQEMKMVDW